MATRNPDFSQYAARFRVRVDFPTSPLLVANVTIFASIVCSCHSSICLIVPFPSDFMLEVCIQFSVYSVMYGRRCLIFQYCNLT